MVASPRTLPCADDVACEEGVGVGVEFGSGVAVGDGLFEGVGAGVESWANEADGITTNARRKKAKITGKSFKLPLFMDTSYLNIKIAEIASLHLRLNRFYSSALGNLSRKPLADFML